MVLMGFITKIIIFKGFLRVFKAVAIYIKNFRVVRTILIYILIF